MLDKSRLLDLQGGYKTPLILVACGSFNPITFAHLRMLEVVKEYISRSESNFEVVGAYISPVNDKYGKTELVEASHRLAMCKMACNEVKNNWITVDNFEASQESYVPTARVLDYFDYELNTLSDGIPLKEDPSKRRKVKIGLVAGSDLIQTMFDPKKWSQIDIDHIFEKYMCFVVQRPNNVVHLGPFPKACHHNGTLTLSPKHNNICSHCYNINIIPNVMLDDTSSTLIRSLRKEGRSISYLTSTDVVDYIARQNLYMA